MRGYHGRAMRPHLLTAPKGRAPRFQRLSAILVLCIGLLASVCLVGPVASPAHAEPGTTGGAQLAEPGKIVNLGTESEPLPKVKATAWLVANMDTGEIYAAKGPHKLRAPASTLKTLTALTLMPQLDPQAEVTAKSKAVNTYGSKVGLKLGRKYTVEELYYALLLPSANDAAIALAQANGSVKKTVAQMNTVAESVGAVNTVAKTPNGLDTPGQVSTAYDLALIGREAMKLDIFRDIVKTKKYAFPYKKRTRDIYNTNQMLTDGYKGALGVKTGYTTNAGRTFIGAAERKGTTLIVVALGIKESTAVAAGKLMDWAFANKDTVTPIGTLNIAPGTTAATSATDTQQAGITPTSQASPGSPAQPAQTSTAGPSTSALDPLAIGWLVLFAAILVFGVTAIRALIVRRRNRGRLPNAGRVKLEG